MNLFMYSVRDALTGFMTPVLEQNDAVAMRNFSMSCDVARRDSSLMSWKPSDFSLYCIASFDSDTGILTPVNPVRLVCNGDSVGGNK
ncbi:nonstructural protein [Dipodfec virus RodF1_56]|uniref:Nonstructural protein n=1 Tax=Dipodfec virus RodF1_56 TaxID=2929303 RepID=A0A976N2C6_9VIRU|nr:nonstructural protein [Dipodfec virus RodF1_56]